MTIFLVRHAQAGSRGAWSGDDFQRPLSGKGTRQARHLVELLGDGPINAIWSSPSRRCTDTVQPLAQARGLEVGISDVLAEGADHKAAVAFMFDQAPNNPVLCSHGDVIPGILRRLRAAGMRSKDGHHCEKGSVWALEVDGGTVVAGRYHPPGH